MGVGSFGGFSPGMAYMATRGARGGYGGSGDGEKPDKEPEFSWLWFSFNLSLLLSIAFVFYATRSEVSCYTREGKLLEMNQSEHKVKQNYYPDYYFTVQWGDRSKEVEVFEVGAKTYFSCHKGEQVFFKRLKPEYEWIDGTSGFILIFGLMIIWVISGIAAVTKYD